MKKNKTKNKNKVFKYLLYIIPVLFFVVVFSFIGWIYYLSQDLPSIEKLEKFDPSLSTHVYSQDGKVLREFFKEKRVLAPLRELPDHLIKCVLATEDRRFYNHWGVDIIRFIKSALVNIKEMRYAQGFSSITQQLAKNLYLSNKKELSRKIKEVLTAIQIEKTYSKNEILEMYLNKVSFGHRVHGIHEAAKVYFGKLPSQLTLEESALLIAQLKGPTRYSPMRNPDKALSRRNLILGNMYSNGYISYDEYIEAKSKPITHILDKGTPRESWGIAPYFTEYIRKKLEKMQEELNTDIYRDGLSIYTTINTGLQKIAEEECKKQLKVQQNVVVNHYKDEETIVDILTEEEKASDKFLKNLKNETFVDSLIRERAPVQCAFICIDPKTGHILAMVGGRDILESKYNRAVQATRQPGSAFKPFIYAKAIEMGVPVTTQFLNQPTNIPDEWGEPWIADNYDHSQGGLETMRKGITKSHNFVTIRLLQKVVTPKNAVEMAKRLGISTPLRPVASLALGTSEVYLKDLVYAYSAFANEGKKPDLVAITKIEDRFGNIIYENKPNTTAVLDREVAYMITSLLQSVVKEGTGKLSWQLYGFNRPAAGKTGTNNEFRDAWFIGYTPQLVSGVWIGFDELKLTLGDNQSGAIAALPIWSNFMRKAHESLNLPEKDFEKPPGIIDLKICEESKKIATPYCNKTYNEVFIRRFKPTEKCDIHSSGSVY